MNLLRLPIAALALLASGSVAFAEPRQLTIPIDFSCPISEPPLIEFVLSRQEGVISVEMLVDDEVAVVIFENMQTDMETLVAALIDAGLGEMLGAQPITEAPVPEPTT
ncbi:hypothetical protein [Phaeovulum sp.]|uniref:hypothetical protein n=1 Tax=Phaeovulum sp. TaxID=2934796 RepID=UPI003562F821